MMPTRFVAMLLPLLTAWITLMGLSTRTATAQLSDTFTNWLEHPAIAYKTTATTDPVALLNARLEAGQVQLRDDGPSGYLRSILDALAVPVESQMAVL
jgi:hypothetical protein